VVTVDIEERDRPEHPRITYLTGSSVGDEVVARIRSQIGPDDKVMAILDSDGGQVPPLDTHEVRM
jgi:cephalosporin hydroxylase